MLIFKVVIILKVKTTRMKKLILFASMVFILASCGKKGEDKNRQNPFFSEFNTPYGNPPFDQIQTSDYMPAFELGMQQEVAEIDSIVNNPEPPTFENTILPLENAGKTLARVSSVFYGVKNANTNEVLDSIAKILSPVLSEHSDNINLNEDLFRRIKDVKENMDENIDPIQRRLIERKYNNFIRSGIALSKEQKERLREINKELSALSLQYADNVLKETSSYRLVIDNEEDLAGLPESFIKAAAERAKKDGLEGKWVITLDSTSWEPFISYAKNAKLREEVFQAMNRRGNNNNETDNKKIIESIINLRIEKANMLGYDSYANYALENTMAKNPKNVDKLLNNLWSKAVPKAKEESKQLLAQAQKEGDNITEIKPSDWWYYAEKVRKDKYNLDEEELKPYFTADSVRNGIFAVANKLYGLSFNPIDIPVYQEDVKAYEVIDHDNSLIGIIYFDDYARPGAKKPGAWMSSFRKQSNKDGERVIPIIYNVGNYNPPSDGKPAMLSLDQTKTMFHEFGHGLHGLLSDTEYNSQSGTAVPRDFVELPSQIMERWAFQPEVLKMYAKNYETGEVLPDELIQKIQNASTFNQGFKTTELTAAAMLDMAFHTLSNNLEIVNNRELKGTFDVDKFERDFLTQKGMPVEIISRYRPTYFQHIFSGGYASGYYSYLWSAVLDSDAFNAFEVNGLFDPATAKSFRENILSKGDTQDPMELYLKFRGQEPDEKHLLKRKGLVK